MINTLYSRIASGTYKHLELVDGITLYEMVHCTDYPDEILQDGFTKCINKIEHIETTKWYSAKERSSTGWVFGFERDSISLANAGDKYGIGRVCVLAPAIKVFHWGDQEMQLITHSSLIRCISPFYA